MDPFRTLRPKTCTCNVGTFSDIYPLFKHGVASISSCCLLPLFLTNWLKATLEVLFLFVETFSPSLHVFSNLERPVTFGKFTVLTKEIGQIFIKGYRAAEIVDHQQKKYMFI